MSVVIVTPAGDAAFHFPAPARRVRPDELIRDFHITLVDHLPPMPSIMGHTRTILPNGTRH